MTEPTDRPRGDRGPRPGGPGRPQGQRPPRPADAPPRRLSDADLRSIVVDGNARALDEEAGVGPAIGSVLGVEGTAANFDLAGLLRSLAQAEARRGNVWSLDVPEVAPM